MPKGVSLNALRVLATVAQTQSFKLAAQRLGVTQSAVSRQIQTLEDQLGMRVIQRDNRMHDLTPAGSLLAPELHRIFSQIEELISSLVENKAADRRLLRIALPDAVLSYFIAPRLQEFYTLYPHLRIEFSSCEEYGGSETQQRLGTMLLHDHVDMVITCADLEGKQLIAQHLRPVYYSQVGNLEGALIRVSPSDDLESIGSKAPANYTHVESTSAALALAQGLNGYTWVPDFIAQGTPNGLAYHANPRVRSRHRLSLQCYFAKHKELELPIVALSNWLLHIAH